MKFVINTFFFVLFICCTSPSYSQSEVDIRYNNDKTYQNQSTSLSAGRWEIIMSDRMAKNTFKIDKYTGAVFVMVKTKDDYISWEFISKAACDTDSQKPNTINYQLFMGALAIRHTYLLNVNTGQAWILVEDKEGAIFFQTID